MPLACDISAAVPVRPPLDAIVASARARAQQGFAAVWWADHLLHWFPQSIWTPDIAPAAARQPSPHTWSDPFALAAAVAQHVPGIRFGIGVTDTVRRHPAALAQTALTLDHVTGGRFILGVGTGEDLNLAPMGMENRRATSRLEEALRAMRLLMSTTDEVDFDGEHVTLRGAAVGLEPFGDAPPPVWVAAHGPRGLAIAGELGDGWMPVSTDPVEYAAMRARVEAAAEAAGRAGAVTPALYCRVVLAEDDDVAAEAAASSTLMRFIALTSPASAFERHGAAHPLGEGMSGISHFVPTGMPRDRALALANRVPPEVARDVAVTGTPDTVAAHLVEMARAGARHIQVVNMSPLASPALAVPSDGLLAEALGRFTTAAKEAS